MNTKVGPPRFLLSRTSGSASAAGDIALSERFLAEMVFPGTPESVRVARHAVEGALRAAGHRELYVALLVLSELVTNAIQHSISGRLGGLVTVDVTEMGEALARIDVIDSGSRDSPRVKAGTWCQCGGRGLAFVETVAVAWGSQPDGLGGTRVWADVATSEDRPSPEATSNELTREVGA